MRASLARVRNAVGIFVTCSELLDGPDLFDLLCSRQYSALTLASTLIFKRFVCCALAQIFACMHIIRLFFPGLEHNDLHTGNIFSTGAASHLIILELAPLIALIIPLVFTHWLELRVADFGAADAPSLDIRRPERFPAASDRQVLAGDELPELVTRLAPYHSVEENPQFWREVSDVLDSVAPAATHAPGDPNGFLTCLKELGCFAWMRVDARDNAVDAWCKANDVKYRSDLVRRVRLYE